jgi:thiamine-phosphate pyrophosphorylase
VPVFCYITDRRSLPGDEPGQRCRLLEKIAEAARCGVDYIQLREKDLAGRELELLARDAVKAVRENTRPRTDNRKPKTTFLVNSRMDVALVSGTDGVHLQSDDITPKEVMDMWERAASISSRDHSPSIPIISVACHTSEEVATAEIEGANLAIFAPMFEKKGSPTTTPAGLNVLRKVCRNKIPVLALGGITLKNAQACLDAGAAGIAGIRLFQDNEIAEILRSLR